jgi:hypothetical protein
MEISVSAGTGTTEKGIKKRYGALRPGSEAIQGCSTADTFYYVALL